MNSSFVIRKLRVSRDRTGVPLMTISALFFQAKALAREGFSWRQVRRAIRAIHPMTMKNLILNTDGTVRLKNPRYVWVRMLGWTRRGK